jgi:chromosome segregation ATPase
MKNFQQNLLVMLALGLCGLCAFQWYEQTQQRNEINALNEMVFQKNSDIQNATNSVATLTQQVEQLDARLTDLKATAATNEQLVAVQKTEIIKLRFTGEGLTNEIVQYKQAVDTFQSKLKDAYDGIGKQNETITNLISERDDLVKKYNDSVKDRNDIVAKYNDLAKQVEKIQSGGNASSGK